MTTEYVCGFLFSPGYDKVVLIRKLRPEWQEGKLNGVGGHIEPGETPDEAIERGFEEETGLIIRSWNHFATLDVPDINDDGNPLVSRVYFYETSDESFERAETKTDEDIIVCGYPLRKKDGEPLGNVETLLRLAYDNWSFVRPIELKDIPAFND